MTIKYGEPISLAERVPSEKLNSQQFEQLALGLTQDLYRVHQTMQPVTLNAIISTAMLTCPKSEVSFKTMKSITKNIWTHLSEKRVKTYVNNPPSNYDIEQAALSLGFSVKGHPNDKKKGDSAILNLSAKEDNLLKLSLSYYKN